MYRIAHISDLHISLGNDLGKGGKLIELLEDIKKRNCNHIAVTGDVADNPIPEDLVYAREIFAQYDLMRPEALSLVPGNHDIFGSAPPGELCFMFPKICSEINKGDMEKQFANIYKNTFYDEPLFPYVKILDNIALIGINSMIDWSIELNPEGSSGGISEDRLDELDKILKCRKLDDKIKIVLIHHHFSKPEDLEHLPGHSLWLKSISYKMDFHEPGKFLKVLKKRKVNLVLHGHTHYTGLYVKKGITFVNSSACLIPLNDEGIRKYNIISIPERDNLSQQIGIETILI